MSHLSFWRVCNCFLHQLDSNCSHCLPGQACFCHHLLHLLFDHKNFFPKPIMCRFLLSQEYVSLLLKPEPSQCHFLFGQVCFCHHLFHPPTAHDYFFPKTIKSHLFLLQGCDNLLLKLEPSQCHFLRGQVC